MRKLLKKGAAITLAAAMVFCSPIAPGSKVASAAGEAPGTDFARITTQPVVKYVFDGKDTDLTLKGATVKDGIITFAADNGKHQEFYAKIADLSKFDFSQGFTWTADVKVNNVRSESGWDWTGFVALGNGTLGTGIPADGVAWHYTVGLSSVLDYKVGNTAGKIGYFGGGQFNNDKATTGNKMVEGACPPAAPYTYEWYKNESNRGRWDTFAVTVSPDGTMTSYINTVPVQTYKADVFKDILTALKQATNNYLGTSYWSGDDDFVGSMDNVGIYNTALSATDIKALTTATTDPNAVSGNNNNQNTTQTGGTTGSVAKRKAKFTVKKGKKKVSKVTVKKGKKVTLKITVVPSKAKLTLGKLTKKQKKIAAVTFKKGKLTIKGKKKGKVTVKITSSKKGVYKKTTKAIKVTVK